MTANGRSALVQQVTEMTGGSIDTIDAIDGLALPGPGTVGVNFFGMVAPLNGLRPPAIGVNAPKPEPARRSR